MPTFVHGSNSDIVVDTSNISDKVDSVTHDRSVDTAETSAFGNDDKTFLAGLEDGGFSLAGHWDTTGDGVIDGCFDGALVNLTYGPGGSAGGAIKYTCAALITNYSTSSSVADRVNWSVSLQRSGALTRGTY